MLVTLKSIAVCIGMHATWRGPEFPEEHINQAKLC